jgi:hypothetical protein
MPSRQYAAVEDRAVADQEIIHVGRSAWLPDECSIRTVVTPSPTPTHARANSWVKSGQTKGPSGCCAR